MKSEEFRPGSDFSELALRSLGKVPTCEICFESNRWKKSSELRRSIPLENFVPSRASMWHICEPLSLYKLKEAFNSQITDIGITKMLEVCNELFSS